jgi:hypothetical protein
MKLAAIPCNNLQNSKKLYESTMQTPKLAKKNRQTPISDITFELNI